MHLIIFIATLLGAIGSAEAAQKVAVLEANGPPKTPTALLMTWTDIVRGVVLAAAPPGYVVLTRSNIEAFLPPGLDLADCEGECEITTARKIGAEYVVGIRVTPQDAAWAITVGLHAAIDGRLLGQGRQIVPEAELEAGLRAAATTAMTAWKTQDDPAVADDPAADAVKVLQARSLRWMGAPVVRISSEHPMALYRGEQFIGHTPVNVLLNGKTSVVVRAEALGRLTRHFRITTGGTSGQVSLSLPPATTTITFAVPWADIIVNDGGRALRGRSHQVAPGRHTFRIIHPCANPAPFEVKVRSGGRQTVRTPHPTICGRLRLEASAQGAEVRWKGRWRALPLDIPAGQQAPHDVVVRAPDHHDLQTRVSRPASGTHVHRFEMSPRTVRLRVETGDWTAKTCHSRVEIDGVDVGVSPWTGEVIRGKHTVKTGCAKVVQRSVTLRRRPYTLQVLDEGPNRFLILSTSAFDTSMISLSGWNPIKRGRRFRFGTGVLLGGLGYRGNPGFGGGIEVGFGVPLSPRYELAGFGALGGASRPCVLEKKAPADRAPEEVCSQAFFQARGVLRIHLAPVLVEAGWTAHARVTPSHSSESRHGPHLGVGWIF